MTAILGLLRQCTKCGSFSTYTFRGRPAWHKTPEGWKCHKCYNEIYRAKQKALSSLGGELKTPDKKDRDLFEMKCANGTCTNTVYVKGASAIGIASLKINCSDCQLTTTYSQKTEKASYVKRILDGQLRLDMQEKDDD